MKVSIAYDNFSRNTGDAAIGVALKDLLSKDGIDHNEINFNHSDNDIHDTIIVGGGLLLREKLDPVYERYKIKGHHILNGVGILGNPTDLHYLNDYKYVSVRSQEDKEKLSYLKTEVHVVPDITMLMERIDWFPYMMRLKEGRYSIGVHLLPAQLSSYEFRSELILWGKKMVSEGYDIFFLPITLYQNDYTPMYEVSLQIPGSWVLPVMSPREVLTTIGQCDFFVSSSLHGGMFALQQNIPFLLFDIEQMTGSKKMKSFMAERGLERFLYTTFAGDFSHIFDSLINEKPNLHEVIMKDLTAVGDHWQTIKSLL